MSYVPGSPTGFPTAAKSGGRVGLRPQRINGLQDLGVPVVVGQAPLLPLPKAFRKMHTVVRDKLEGRVVNSRITQCEGGLELRLVKDFSQKTVIDELADPKVRSGVCAGISRKWMQKSAAQQDFWQSLDNDAVTATIQLLQHNENNCRKGQLMALQRMAKTIGSEIPKDLPASAKAIESAKKLFSGNNRWTPARAQELNSLLLELEEAHENYGRNYLKENSEELCKEPIVEKFDSAAKLCESLQNKQGYALILTKGANAGHAIAAYFSAGKVRIMDPNHGEVASNSATLAGECLRSHLDAMKHDLGPLEKITLEFYPHPQPPGRLEETVAANSNAGDSELVTEARGNSKVTQNSNNDPVLEPTKNSNN